MYNKTKYLLSKLFVDMQEQMAERQGVACKYKYCENVEESA